MDYYRPRKRTDKTKKGKIFKAFSPRKIAITVLVFFIGGIVLGNFFVPNYRSRLFNHFTKFKNVLSSTVLGKTPNFHYIEIEKDGKDYKLENCDSLKVSYRDEFIIKKVSTDSMFGRGVYVDIEGVGNDNDLMVLFKGIDLVDMAIKDDRDFKIDVVYKDKAIATIPVLVDVTPQDWMRLAKGSKTAESSIECLERAVSMKKEDTNARKMLAKLYINSGMVNKGIAEYEKVLRQKPDDLNALTELSKIYVRKGQYGKAISLYRRIIKSDPKNKAEAYAEIAFAYGKLGKWSNAAANYEASASENPDNIEVLYNLADAYRRVGNADKAIDAYRKVLKYKPGDIVVMDSLASACLEKGNYDESIELYRKIVKKRPNSASAYANLGLAYGGKGVSGREIANYKKAVSIDSRDPVIHFNLGMAYEKEKLYKQAVKEYEAVLKIKPDDTDTLLRLAEYYLTKKNYKKSVSLYEKVVNILPKNAEAYATIGFIYGKLKKYGKSAQNCEKAIRYGIKDREVHYNLAFAYGKMGDEKKAIREYERYISYKPNAEVLGILVEYYLKAKKYDKAMGACRKIIKLDPKSSVAYAGLARIYGLKGDVAKEIANYKASIKYNGKDYSSRLGLGKAYEKKGMYKEALKEYTSAHQLNPDSSEAIRKIPEMKIKILQQKYE